MTSCLEDLPTELFFSIFDYFWAHELFISFAHLNSRIDQIISISQLHISSENEDVLYSPERVVSLLLTTSPVSLDDYLNLRSLTLNRCHLDRLPQFPASLSRLCIKNTSLPAANLQMIFESSTLTNVQLDLHHKLSVRPTIAHLHSSHSRIEHLAINYISLDDIIALLPYLSHLKSLHLSLFGTSSEPIRHFTPVPTVTRLTCLSMGLPFDQLCSQFLSVYFPHVHNLSIFTSYVDARVCISSLEELLMQHLARVKRLNVSAQFLLNRTGGNSNYNIESIATRFRTAFWLKRNCRVTFRCCHDDPHAIRMYLQANGTVRRARPSRF